MQRENMFRAPGPSEGAHSMAGAPRITARTSLPGNSLAPGAARRFVRAALADWTERGVGGLGDLLAADALVIVSELVTNAVVHAGTDVELLCRLDEDGLLVVEVSDHHPSRTVREESSPYDGAEYGRGLRLVAALADCWGITYRTGSKTVWARLPMGGASLLEAREAYAGRAAYEGAEDYEGAKAYAGGEAYEGPLVTFS